MDNEKEECLYAAGGVTTGRAGGAGGLGQLVSTQSVLMNRLERGKGMTIIQSHYARLCAGHWVSVLKEPVVSSGKTNTSQLPKII